MIEIIGVIATIIGTLVAIYYGHKQLNASKTPRIGDEDFQESLKKNQIEFAKIIPEGRKYEIWSDGKSRFDIINGNISETGSEIIVSTDDNLFSASGGVAKAISGHAGRQVAQDLDILRRFRWRQGSVAITRAGKFQSRYIAHAVVIDHNKNLYPNESLIRKITEKCLAFADTVNADSIAFPVFGGGTASKHLSAAQSINSIIESVKGYLQRGDSGIEYVALYVFDGNDIPKTLSPAPGSAPGNQ